jgi:hypothetical protein
MERPAPLLPPALALAALCLAGASLAAPVHTTYLWHMHQPIYWPDRSVWNGRSYEHAFETITLGHSASDEFTIFNSDDRVRDYQDYPKLALSSVLDLPDAGAQDSFAGSHIQNVTSLAAAGWNGGRYAPSWNQPYRDAMGWTTSGGRRRLDQVLVSFHHPINPLIDEAVFRRMIQAQKAIMPAAWGSGARGRIMASSSVAGRPRISEKKGAARGPYLNHTTLSLAAFDPPRTRAK